MLSIGKSPPRGRKGGGEDGATPSVVKYLKGLETFLRCRTGMAMLIGTFVPIGVEMKQLVGSLMGAVVGGAPMAPVSLMGAVVGGAPMAPVSRCWW